MKRLLLILVIISVKIQAQTPAEALETFSKNYPSEKIYIHYDKESYVAGETIWLKAYLMSEGKPSSISTNLFLQLIDSKGQVVTSSRFPVMGAVTKGNINLADSLPQGNYYVRAFTPYTLNFDESFIYKKNVFVYNPGSKNRAVAAVPRTVSIQFFPESGHLVDSISMVVGFKANDQYGMPVELNGVIRTEDGATVAPFKTFHDGMGKTQFRPRSGKKYIAEFETAAGKRTVSLPEVQSAGINLKIQDEPGGKMFTLSRTNKNAADYGTLVLIATMNSRIVYENEINFEDYPAVKGHIITDSLPTGILHFTVFNKNIPIAERLSFVNNGEYYTDGSIEIVKQGLAKREQNQFDIVFSEAIQRSASVSITDETGMSLSSMDNIYARNFLSSDLRGYIHNPGYYFQRSTDSILQAVDNLMLTHGWTRYNWSKLLSKQLPERTMGTVNFFGVSGYVKQDQEKYHSGGRLNIYAEAEDSSTQNFEIPVDSKGRFVLDSVVIYGKTKFYYVYMNNDGKPRQATVVADENPFSRIVTMVPLNVSEYGHVEPGTVSQTDLAQRAQFAKSQLDTYKELPNVSVKATTHKTPIDALNDKYASGVFRTPGKENIDNVNQPTPDKSMNGVDFVKNRIQQLEIQNGKFVNRKNFSLISGQKWAVQVFINEAPSDISFLRILRADQIAFVKFFEAGFVGVGSSAPGGALAVYTKDQAAEAPKPEKLEFFKVDGYSVVKEFYHPDYNSPDTRKDIADRRTTLYWNPDVYTDNETKRISLKFFNNDFSKKFRVIVEGFDAEGKLIRIERIIGN